MNTLLVDCHSALLKNPAAPIDSQTALELLRLPASCFLDIVALAQLSRSHNKPNDTFTCGIVNAKSGLCPEDCVFCAQSAQYATGVSVYPLIDTHALLQRAETLARAGVARFGIVTSGTAVNAQELDALCTAAEHIRTRVNIGLCASLGQLSEANARKLKEAGFSRYHHNLETAASFFPHICTTHLYEDDLNTIRAAQRAGLQVCSGGILGLGERLDQVVEFSTTLADLQVDSIPVNFLIPIAGTPMETRPLLDARQALTIVAVLRLLHPTRDILICGGREKILDTLNSLVFAAGANGIMTGNYLTTTGCSLEADTRLLTMLGVRA